MLFGFLNRQRLIKYFHRNAEYVITFFLQQCSTYRGVHTAAESNGNFFSTVSRHNSLRIYLFLILRLKAGFFLVKTGFLHQGGRINPFL
jgi:hypothetical protein